MKIISLISGGKDSIFSLMHCKSLGHEIKVLANLYPARKEGGDSGQELDSWMFQSIGAELIPLLAECIGLPLFRRPIRGKSRNVSASYTEIVDGDEVEDLYNLLLEIKSVYPDIEGVCSGAILSSYQRVRVETVCARLSLVSIAPLWMQDQNMLLGDMVASGLTSILVKTAAVGLDRQDLGKSLSKVYPKLLKLNKLYDLHLCGEGGEYETFTLDAPFFTKRIEIVKSKVIEHSDGVWYLIVEDAVLVEKAKVDESWQTAFKYMIQEKYNCLIPGLCGFELGDEETIDEQNIKDLQITDRKAEKLNSINVSISANTNSFVAISGVSISESLGESESFIFEKTQKLMGKLQSLLLENGSSLDNALQVTIYVRDMANFGELNRAYASFVSSSSPPTRVTVSSKLFNGALIQIDVISAKSPLKTDQLSLKPSYLYVQGISYWAPSNIGPYSQCALFKDTLWLSGMIGLIPCSMDLESPSFQALQSLSSVERVAQNAFRCSITRDVLACICYVTKKEAKSVERVWRHLQGFDKDDEEEEEVDILVVQVPNLPRDAVVEWQLTLFSLDGYRSVKTMDPEIDPSSTIQPPARLVAHKQLRQDQYLLQGRLQLVTQGSSVCVSGHVFSDQSVEEVDDCLVFKKTEFLAEQAAFFITQSGKFTVVSARIFYPDNAATPSFKEQEALQKVFGPDVAITYVPVEKVARKKSAIGLFVYGFTYI